MGISDQIIQMRAQGLNDSDIIVQLQEQGVAPKIINDALNQANIKGAVGEMEEIKGGPNYADDYTPVPQPSENYASKAEPYPSDDFYVSHNSSPNSTYSQPLPPAPTSTYQEFYPQEQGQGYYEGGTDTDTMIEIAQQVFSEKIRKIQQQIEEMNEFKVLYSTKVDGMFERLKRIENLIDRLQSAILAKIGSYGEGIESVKKELSMVQDAYGKVVSAVSEKHHAHHQQPSAHSKASSSHKAHAKKSPKSSHKKK